MYVRMCSGHSLGVQLTCVRMYSVGSRITVANNTIIIEAKHRSMVGRSLPQSQ